MNFELINNNKVYIAGMVENEPQLSHEVLGEKFYEFNLKVKRLSGYCDIIPITVSDKLLESLKITVNENLACVGQFRSYNKQTDVKSKLMLTVFAREFVPYDSESNPNVLEIVGYVCKEPIYRTTPFKREICDVLIAVNRGYNKSDYLPCIAWGKNAKDVKAWAVGDRVKIHGRIQSRNYVKKLSETETVQKTAYEISINSIEKCQEKEADTGMELGTKLSSMQTA